MTFLIVYNVILVSRIFEYQPTIENAEIEIPTFDIWLILWVSGME